MTDNIAQCKLILLYALDRVGPMSGAQILRFTMENGLADYIDTQLTLADLIDSGLVAFAHQDDTRVFHFTRKGRDTLDALASKLNHSTRETIDRLAPDWGDLVRDERQIRADFEPMRGGGYIVRLCAYENNTTLLAIDVRVANRAQAERACRRFRERPGDALASVTDVLLFDEADEGEDDDGSDEGIAPHASPRDG